MVKKIKLSTLIVGHCRWIESWKIRRTNGFVSASEMEQNGHIDFKPLVPKRMRMCRDGWRYVSLEAYRRVLLLLTSRMLSIETSYDHMDETRAKSWIHHRRWESRRMLARGQVRSVWVDPRCDIVDIPARRRHCFSYPTYDCHVHVHREHRHRRSENYSIRQKMDVF